jgi:hypothetical protein
MPVLSTAQAASVEARKQMKLTHFSRPTHFHLATSARKIAQCIEGMNINSIFFEILKNSDLSSSEFWLMF